MLMHALKAAATCAAPSPSTTAAPDSKKNTPETRPAATRNALSPLPFACIVANCVVYGVLYGVIGRDVGERMVTNANAWVNANAYVERERVYQVCEKRPPRRRDAAPRLLVVGFAWRGDCKRRRHGGGGAPKSDPPLVALPLDVDGETRDALGLLGVGACVVMFASGLSTIDGLADAVDGVARPGRESGVRGDCSVLWALYGSLEGDSGYGGGARTSPAWFVRRRRGLLFLLFGCPKAWPADDPFE